MRITLRLIVSLLLAAAAVVFAFSSVQTQIEDKKLSEDLNLRARLVAKSFKEAIEPFLEQTERPDRIRKFIEKFKGHTRLIGTVVQLKDSSFISAPGELADDEIFHKELLEVIEGNEIKEARTRWQGRELYLLALPLEKDAEIVGALGVVHDRSYIAARVREFRKRMAVTFSILALILSVTTLIVIRWSITGPIAKIAEMVRRATGGEIPPPSAAYREKGEIEKLFFEVRHMAAKLKAARLDLVEQSRVINAEGSIWTKERLKEYLKTKLDGKPFFIVANREPYIHRKTANGTECISPASGVVTALDPVMQATGGMWIAHGAGDADRETAGPEGKIAVPPWKPSYTLKRVWLGAEEEQGYYYGFANEGLWPLCHISHVRPVFRMGDWQHYQQVNRKFARALLEELDDSPPFILIQDYHFALLPRMIKEERPDAKVALFWHIPWPNPEAFGICPWQEEILEGMLGADLIGFHTQFHCNNFLDTVDRVLESRIDWTNFGVVRGGKTSHVMPFPISVAAGADREKSPEAANGLRKIKSALGLEGKKIGIGVDRIDYTKGLLERFRALERTLEKYPQYAGKLVFIELGAPSRTLIPGYRNHMQDVEELVQKINTRFGSGDYVPILFLKEHHAQAKVHEFYKLADFCMVSSLHDGMNLVAKEFVASRDDAGGVLILSRFAGASYELQSALQINPYDIENTADSIHQALTMLPEEQKARMLKMREIVQDYNVYRWAADLITELVKSF